MIVAAAQLQECSTLLSEDFQDGMVFGGVAVRNPFTARVAEQHVEYAAPRWRSPVIVRGEDREPQRAERRHSPLPNLGRAVADCGTARIFSGTRPA
jgi:hypothetical protein